MIVRQSFKVDNKVKYYVRYIFDLTIFYIVNMIGLNIIFGIIIQNFAQMRGELNEKVNDIENICFVCSIPRIEVRKDQSRSRRL